MLIWTKPAKLDVINFINNSYYKNSSKKYFYNLCSYLDILPNSPNLGKTIYINKDNSILKQLIYKKHKIFYLVKESNVYILAILYSNINPEFLEKRLNNFIN